jgi:hypothetical protein
MRASLERLSMIVALALGASLADPPWASKSPLPRPEVFAPGVISTGQYDSHAVFAADGSAVWFLKSTPSFDAWTIVSARWEDERWSRPEVAPFSGRWSDADPFLSADGKQLFFISNRPVQGEIEKDLDLWVVDRGESGWSEPRNLGAPVNSPGNEWFPSIAGDGTLYFGSDRPGGKGRTDIWRARLVDGSYAEPENLGDAIHSRFDEFETCEAPDESFLVLMTTRPGGPGGGDLWVSERHEDTWQPARCLEGEINSPAFEIGPRLTPDGKYLVFASSRAFALASREQPLDYSELSRRLDGPGNGLGDVYRVELRSVLGR